MKPRNKYIEVLWSVFGMFEGTDVHVLANCCKMCLLCNTEKPEKVSICLI